MVESEGLKKASRAHSEPVLPVQIPLSLQENLWEVLPQQLAAQANEIL